MATVGDREFSAERPIGLLAGPVRHIRKKHEKSCRERRVSHLSSVFLTFGQIGLGGADLPEGIKIEPWRSQYPNLICPKTCLKA